MYRVYYDTLAIYSKYLQADVLGTFSRSGVKLFVVLHVFTDIFKIPAGHIVQSLCNRS